MPLLASELSNETKFLQISYGFVDGWEGHAELFLRGSNGEYNAFFQEIMDSQGGRGPFAQPLDLLPVLFKHRDKLFRCVTRLLRYFRYTSEIESQPALPISFRSYTLKGVVIIHPVLFKEKAQVEEWLGKRPLRTQDERDQKAAQAAVAIQKWVNGFELGMGKSRFDQCGGLDRVVMQKFFQGAHCGQDFVRRRRHIYGVPRPTPADPVLGAAKFAWFFIASACLLKEQGMDLPYETKAQGEPFF